MQGMRQIWFSYRSVFSSKIQFTIQTVKLQNIVINTTFHRIKRHKKTIPAAYAGIVPKLTFLRKLLNYSNAFADFPMKGILFKEK